MDNPPTTKYVLRVILLVIAAGLAGGCCGFVEPAFVVPGFVFGFALALGIPVIHFFCRNRLTRGEPVKWKVAILAAVISGVIGAVSATILTQWSYLAFLHMMSFSVVLHLAYQVRWKFGVIGFLAAAVTAAVLAFLSAQVIGAMFAVLWLAAIAPFDPAWSFKRWKNIWPGKAVEGQTCVLHL